MGQESGHSLVGYVCSKVTHKATVKVLARIIAISMLNWGRDPLPSHSYGCWRFSLTMSRVISSAPRRSLFRAIHNMAAGSLRARDERERNGSHIFHNLILKLISYCSTLACLLEMSLLKQPMLMERRLQKGVNIRRLRSLGATLRAIYNNLLHILLFYPCHPCPPKFIVLARVSLSFFSSS